MNRDELLDKLHGITFCASLTALTSEECLEVEILTGDGVSYSWIGYDEWFVYELKKIEKNKWNFILGKLLSRTLSREDLQGTDLYRLLESQDESVDLIEFFKTLKNFPEEVSEDFYCVCGEGEPPVFYESQEIMAKDLKETYSDIVNVWENMNEDELEHWLQVYEQCDGIPCCYFNDED